MSVSKQVCSIQFEGHMVHSLSISSMLYKVDLWAERMKVCLPFEIHLPWLLALHSNRQAKFQIKYVIKYVIHASILTMQQLHGSI